MSALMPAQLVSQDAELTQLKLELSCVTDNPQYVYLITASTFYSHVLLFTYCCSVCYWLTTAVTLTSHMHTLHTNFLFCFNTLWNRQHIVILWTSNTAQGTQTQSSSTGYGPRSRIFFEGNQESYQIWETGFTNYLYAVDIELHKVYYLKTLL